MESLFLNKQVTSYWLAQPENSIKLIIYDSTIPEHLYPVSKHVTKETNKERLGIIYDLVISDWAEEAGYMDDFIIWRKRQYDLYCKLYSEVFGN
jgi:hypothetical protein